MLSNLFIVPALINSLQHVSTLMDDGCNIYAMIEDQAARQLHLPRFQLTSPLQAASYNDQAAGMIREVAIIDSLDIGGSKAKQGRVFAYIAPRIEGEHSLILGRPWRESEDAYIDPATETLHIRRTGISLRNHEIRKEQATLKAALISATCFQTLVRRYKKTNPQSITVAAVSIADIEKALQGKPSSDPRAKLPKEYWEWLPAFDKVEADKLPPHRKGVDHQIVLESKGGEAPQIPSGPLYGMSREMLLVLRKTLTELLDKGFIRVSSSPAAAPVLFVRKPGGGLRFCVDYRALNAITRKDRYPLPLIRETLHQIGKAKWFTKLDIIAAFNKIRVAEGDEWKTAFNTRFGLFEWLVTPFGLANAPSTFQRYINESLREYLDDFVSAYVDDVLIYTSGTLKEHQQKVKQVLQRLMDAGLQIDIDKCEFSVQTTKYLGFIIEAGKGIRMDPQKVQAIQDWEAPTTVRGVRGFLGFANFYRQFIRGFSEIVAPLTALTKKDVEKTKFTLDEQAQEAFEYLKKAFVSAPILAQYDADRETILECDASGWCTGGTLMQYDEEGVLHPVAFMSKRMLPAECNYEIYDKEMLAIVRCLEEWEELLKPLPYFLIRTDHRNLQYFTKAQKLSERQARWALLLSQFNFQLEYKPGKLNVLADALSRRDQDMPKDVTDPRIQERINQVLKPVHLERVAHITPVEVHLSTQSTEEPTVLQGETDPTEMEQRWQEALHRDEDYKVLLGAAKEGSRTVPESCRHLKISASDLSEADGKLLWRGRLWVPGSEPLRTGLIQEMHDSYLTGHPGKNTLVGLMSRYYFWPRMTEDIRTFVRNCYACGRNTVWRDRKKGLLHPLPVPERIWSEISMDYITDLPETKSGNRHLLVITDRLSKGVIFIPVPDLSGEMLAKEFIHHYVAHHGLPKAITSDRGTQFVQGIWAHICKQLRIKQRLSTAFHPETDGSTERMNQTLEEFLRHHCNYYQNDWDEWLPLAQIAISARDATSTGVSPFFLSHGYHANLGGSIPLPEKPTGGQAPRNPMEAAQKVIEKLRECVDFTQTAMASAQQRQEETHNKSRDPAVRYQPGDKVWLDVRNIPVDPARKKKLSELHQQYTVLAAVGRNAYRLDIPGETYDVFNTSLLRPVAKDPLPSQIQDDVQPVPLIVDGEQEYEIEEILDVRVVRGRGRGGPLKRQFLCKWRGYASPSWNEAENCSDTVALDHFEARTGRDFQTEPLVLSEPARKRGRGIL